MLGWFKGLSHFIHLIFSIVLVTINEPITALIFVGSSKCEGSGRGTVFHSGCQCLLRWSLTLSLDIPCIWDSSVYKK